jgi:hypothetical protein
MTFTRLFQRAMRLLIVTSLLGWGLSMAQSEPTMAEIYSTAQAGKLDQAQVMVQQVLVAHPNSAKAHFVQSELYARQGNVARARDALATAEKLAPGLPFAKAEAVQALRAQLSSSNVPVTVNAAPVVGATSPAAANKSSGSGWVMPLLLAGGAIVVGYFLFRRKSEPAVAYGGGMGTGLNGPQTFGAGNGMPGGYPPAGYGPAGYGAPGYGQPAGSGLGGRIMGGVATGLAVGAGVVAAEAIGRNLLGGNHESGSNSSDAPAGHSFEPLPGNADMGGQDFGINDTSSWDSGGGGGGSDWDN